jgi:cellobiose-specific phosphotransferase system component IIA
LQEAGNELAKAFGAVMAEKEAQKQVKSELKATMDKLNEAHYNAWRQVTTGMKEIEVKVDFILDGGMVTEVRTDTGEVVLERSAFPDELQGSF